MIDGSVILDFTCSMEELKEVLPEGLPMGMLKEFEESCRSALLVRQCFIDLRDNFRQVADPSLVVNSKGSPLHFFCIYVVIRYQFRQGRILLYEQQQTFTDIIRMD